MTLRAWTLFRQLDEVGRGNTHHVEEIHQLSQLRSLEIEQIVVFSITLDQVKDSGRGQERRG
jgi:hypothetical protein